MKRAWLTHLGAWILGCGAAMLLQPTIRAALSPWNAIGKDRVIMFSSDTCLVSRRALQLLRKDPRLTEFIVPAPAGGPEHAAPMVCAAAQEILGRDSLHIRWLPAALACRWLTEDAVKVVPEEGVPTPSWYVAGKFFDHAGSDEEAALFREHGWRIAWTSTGLQLSRLDEPAPPAEETPPIRRIEDLGMSTFRDDRW